MAFSTGYLSTKELKATMTETHYLIWKMFSNRI